MEPITKSKFNDKDGLQQEIAIRPEHYLQAQKEGLSLRQYLNKTYPTKADGPDTFEQCCESVGMRINPVKSLGYRPMTMAEVVYGGNDVSISSQFSETHPIQSRSLFPAVLAEMVENKLQFDRSGAVTAFNGMLALTTSVAGRRVEQPVIDYTRKGGPESARNTARAQGAEPNVMMTIKASDKALTIPETPIAIVITDEALQSTTIDQVGLAMSRQAEVESFTRVGEDLLKVLQGDLDAGSYGTGALTSVTAKSFDDSITTAGVLTQTALIKWLYTGIAKRRVNYIVTDIAGALAYEARTGRPTNVLENSVDRIDTKGTIFFPSLITDVKIFVAPPEASWPANTLMGFDSMYAMQRWINTLASYSDVENFVLRRSKAVVTSFGTKVTRYFDDAFTVLTLTTS